MADSSWEHVEQLQAEIAALEAEVGAAGGSSVGLTSDPLACCMPPLTC